MQWKAILKLGQLAGFALMAAGVMAFVQGRMLDARILFLAGAVVYAGCRIAAWLRV